MQATKETVQKRPHTALWIILCVVLLCAAGAALYFCRWAEKPLTLAEGYVAAGGLTADITDGEGAVLSQPVRGTKVTYVVEDEDKDHPGLVRLVLGEDNFGYLAREHLVTDPKDVVATKIIYVRTAVNLLDEAGAVPGRLVQKGEALTVTGWQDMDASGAVGRWQVEGGYIRAEYVTMDEPSAKAQYDQEVYQLHAERGDSWGGGDAAGLDYFPREKASFEGHPMPGEVKALYLNNESIAQAAEYVEVADSCGINAFVVDIMDGGAIAYPSEVMKQYSPSAYESAYNTLEVYQTGIKTLKNAGYYVIGRIITSAIALPIASGRSASRRSGRSFSESPMAIVALMGMFRQRHSACSPLPFSAPMALISPPALSHGTTQARTSCTRARYLARSVESTK